MQLAGLGECCKLPQHVNQIWCIPYSLTLGASSFTNFPVSYCDFSMQLMHNLHTCGVCPR